MNTNNFLSINGLLIYFQVRKSDCLPPFYCDHSNYCFLRDLPNNTSNHSQISRL